MFTKKQHSDIKKSTQKLLDAKKDSATRLKHLRILIENVDSAEGKTLFELYYSPIYYILYDNFITVESNLRQRVHKAHREELETVLYILEKVLVYLPELLSKKWQCHSLTRIMQKLLHPGNSIKLRREAVRLFLLWYQMLGDGASENIHAIFASLVPGFPISSQGLDLQMFPISMSMGSAVFHDESQGPVTCVEICPVLVPPSGEKQPEDPTRYFLECLTECMVSQATKIHWNESLSRQQRCFNFLFDNFKKYYLPHIFPEFSWTTSLYRPSLELPELRKINPAFLLGGNDSLLNCKVVLIKWVANYTHVMSKTDMQYPMMHSGSSLPVDESKSISSSNVDSSVHPTSYSSYANSMSGDKESLTSMSSINEDESMLSSNIVRDVLYSSRENVNFIHEVYRQAFLLSFTHSSAIRKVIAVYKDWIQMNVPELPPFMLEPLECPARDEQGCQSYLSLVSSDTITTEAPDGNEVGRLGRLRNDSYLGAIHKEHLHVRAGLQHLLQVFITNSANVFLLEIGSDMPMLLEEQIDICKRILNIYRFMVMNTKMEQKTWEQLLLILLQITSLTLSETPPKRREETLGGRLAAAVFQTLIVTWIKANLNVVISTDLWDQFLMVLSSLTQWEELIKEWTKTLETLTRVLARHVYGLDLTDLPLERLSEQKTKKRRGKMGPASDSSQCFLFMPRRGSEPPPEKEDELPSASTINEENSGNSSQSPYSWKRHGSTEHSPKSPRPIHQHYPASLIRSFSESNLLGKVGTLRNKMREDRTHSRIRAMPEGDFRLLGNHDEYLKKVPSKLNRKRSRSMDSLRHKGHYGDLSLSRTPSPAPSSGLESSSIKDSPIQIDVLAGDNTSLGSSTEHQSVMSGGTIRGWLPDVAVVLWRRMLGALGDVNLITRPNIHSQVFEYLVELCDTLTKIRLNQGVTLDNVSTPLPPELVPPITLIASWCFKALTLPSKYQKGHLYAYTLLCKMTVTIHDIPLLKDHIVQFYHVLHSGLVGADQDVVNTIVRHCGSRFFSLMLPGFTLLMYDFIHGADSILSSSVLKLTPRVEAASVLGSLLCFPNVFGELSVLDSHPTEFRLIRCTDAKDDIVATLIQACKREPTGMARCISISSLGIYLYEELSHHSFHRRIREAIDVLLRTLTFNNRSVAQVACDMILLLCDHLHTLLMHYPDMVVKVIEVLSLTLPSLLPVEGCDVKENDKRLILSLLNCLGEWCMHTPEHVLSKVRPNGLSLLHLVFKMVGVVAHGKLNEQPVPDATFQPAEAFLDFDPNIQWDNLVEKSTSPSSPKHNTLQSEKQTSPTSADAPPPISKEMASVRLGARTLMQHLVNHLSHFPMGIGAPRISSLVSEHDDLPSTQYDELSQEVLTSPYVQLFVLNNSAILSLVEIPTLEVPGGGAALGGMQTAASQVRIIMRDITGKTCWDASILYGPMVTVKKIEDVCEEVSETDRSSSISKDEEGLMTSSFLSSSMLSSPPRHTLRHRPSHVLPMYENTEDDMDNLDDLLQYIGHTSPECLDRSGEPLNLPAAGPVSLPQEIEEEMITTLLNQRNFELEYVRKHENDASLVPQPTSPPNESGRPTPFQYCRLLFSQLGLAGWERRQHIDLLSKNEKLVRELRNLDKQHCRETHKIAVVYVGEGQEDKNSILSNSGGSQAYEEFVAGLAWEVELESHMGFLGGLQKNKTSGDTAPYYATSFIEVIFHVATRMPSHTEESMLQKTRHLGNDEVHVVWSEHDRDYRRGIIPTEFCDILIVIYPLLKKLFRIQVSRKSEVPYFGPLFNEVIVDHLILPGLVRATAINASRAKRSMLPFYQTYYEERAKTLQTLINNHKETTSYEDFIANVYSPQQPQPFQPGPTRASGTSFISRNSDHSHMYHSHVAAALIDSQPPVIRPTVSQGFHEPRSRVSDPSSIETKESHNLSPKPPKRLSFKANHRKTSFLKGESTAVVTPPDSPIAHRNK